MKYLKNTIINFHAVYNKDWMELVLLFLKKHYNIVSINEIEQFYYRGKKLKNSCHITFDDGDISFYEIVFPLLKKHKIPVSIFVSPLATKQRKNFWFQEIRGYDQDKLRDIIKQKNYYADIDKISILNAVFKSLRIEQIWDIIEEYKKITRANPKVCINMTVEQLIDLDKSGLVAIGAHTQNHPILLNESDAVSEYELNSSIEELSSILNHQIKYFAYPNGTPGKDFSEREIKYLKESNITLCFSTETNFFSIDDDTLKIPRNGLSKGNMRFIFVKLLLGSKYGKIKRLIKGRTEKDFR
jgi:peptidoglycan/xylan/chitin deacetylase (PgdA/CDA1 family)